MMYEVETPYMKIGLGNGIVHCLYADKLELDLEAAKICVDARLRLQAGKSYPVLVDMRGIKTATKEARTYLSTRGIEGVKAGALVVSSALTRMLGNIFLKIDKPAVPTRLFTDLQEAEGWLQAYL